METSYLGLPLIGTDVIGTNEVVVDGINGFLVSINDVPALADRIRRLYEDEDLWKEMSKNARQIAEKEFDESVIAKRLISIYRALYEDRIDELVSVTEGGKAWQNVSL